MDIEKRKLIKTIYVNEANLKQIGESGIISGTLLLEIERVMEEYTQEIKTHKCNLSKENDELRKKLFENGFCTPPIKIDYSRNA